MPDKTDEHKHSESRLWTWLRDRRFDGYKFRRQYPVSGFILDFDCPELKLAVEVDGKHHDTADMSEYDSARETALNTIGIEIVRIPNRLLKRDSLLTEECIRVAITNSRPKR